jgi:hypothetical protein
LLYSVALGHDRVRFSTLSSNVLTILNRLRPVPVPEKRIVQEGRLRENLHLAQMGLNRLNADSRTENLRINSPECLLAVDSASLARHASCCSYSLPSGFELSASRKISHGI